VKISPSFDLQEFECHNGDDVPPELIPNVTNLCVGVLQRLRDKWGALIIISGYRSPAYNARIGGAKASTHMTAQGADIRPMKIGDVNELAETVLAMHAAGELPALGGLGIYRNWIHVDTKKAADGHLRRWNGKGVGSEHDGS
jgi:uncharacterized protein YcbK (DUF882 family)